MITIYAEKPDVGTKIAAALDAIVLSSGDRVDFDHIQKYEKQIKAQRAKQGYFKIRHNGEETYVTWGIGHLCELKPRIIIKNINNGKIFHFLLSRNPMN